MNIDTRDERFSFVREMMNTTFPALSPFEERCLGVIELPRERRRSTWNKRLFDVLDAAAANAGEHQQLIDYMSGFEHRWERPVWSADSLDQLARFVELLPLARFTFSPDHNHKDADLVALSKDPMMRHVHTLQLDCNKGRAPGMRALAESEHLSDLVALDIGGHKLHIDALEALCQGVSFDKLATLSISSASLGGKGGVALATSEAFLNLETLHLNENKLGAKGITALANSKIVHGLGTLSIEHNNVGVGGAKALAQSDGLSSLSHLQIGENLSMKAAGLEHLVQSDSLRGLRTLNLSRSALKEDRVSALASATFDQLASMDLSSCMIDDDALALLYRSGAFDHLAYLNLRHNHLTMASMTTLSELVSRQPIYIILSSNDLDRDSLDSRVVA